MGHSNLDSVIIADQLVGLTFSVYRFAGNELVAPLFATHYHTSKPIPLELLRAIRDNKVTSFLHPFLFFAI